MNLILNVQKGVNANSKVYVSDFQINVPKMIVDDDRFQQRNLPTRNFKMFTELDKKVC